jgi:hypothetical protein
MGRLFHLAAGVAIAAGLHLSAAPAHAMTYSWRTVGDHIIIDASGDIQFQEKTIFVNWVMSQNWNGKKAWGIVLNSPGGSVVGAMQWQAWSTNTT